MSGKKNKFIGLGVIALVLAGGIGFSLGNNKTLIKSDSKPKTTVTTSTSSSQTTTDSNANTTNADNGNYKHADLKPKCVSALKDYSTSIRAKAESMAAKVRAQVASDGNNADASKYKPQIDELLAYVKTMQTNMTKLNTCINQVDQKRDFSTAELAQINTAIAASKNS